VSKLLAFGQYGELGPGFEQLLDQLAEKGADEATKRYLIPNRVVAKGVQLRALGLLRQRVVMTDQWQPKRHRRMCSSTGRLHYALPGWDAAAERRDAQDELHSAAQARAWADGDFDVDHSPEVGRGSGVAPCSGHGDGGQLEVTRQWVWRRRGAWRR
jgi:hypothetical protein